MPIYRPIAAVPCFGLSAGFCRLIISCGQEGTLPRIFYAEKRQTFPSMSPASEKHKKPCLGHVECSLVTIHACAPSLRQYPLRAREVAGDLPNASRFHSGILH